MSVTLSWRESHGDDHTLVDVLVEGPTNRNALFVDLLANLPTTYGDFALQKVEAIDLVEGFDDFWKGSVRYGAYKEKTPLQSGEMEFTFNTSLQTFRRTISRSSQVYGLFYNEETEAYSTGLVDPAPPDATIIGWKPESRQAMGVDDTEPGYSFGWNVIVPFTTATATWRKSVGELVGTLNAATFFGYAAEECKLLAINDVVRGDGEYKLTLQFARKPHHTDVPIGELVIPTLKGWDIVDVPEMKFFEVDGRLVPKVSFVKIHAGPLAADWSALAAMLGV